MANPFKALLDPTTTTQDNDVEIEMFTFSERYSIGDPTRPPIVHDNGFLDHYPPEEPTPKDKLSYQYWHSIALGAKVLCTPTAGKDIKECNYEDQSDAADAYLHYLNGSGDSRENVNYEKFLTDDPSGKIAYRLILEDAKKHIEVIGKNRTSFSVTSLPYYVGSQDELFASPELSQLYPKTVNWKRTIGAHAVWISADVQTHVSSTANGNYRLTRKAKITFHMEDMYNFNPKGKDIPSGIDDSVNGRFQIVGLAKQYINRGTYVTELEW